MRRGLTAACFLAGLNLAHPFHASTADVTVEKSGATRVVVRVFTDDLTAAAGANADAQRAYLASRFQLRDQRGARIMVLLDSMRVEGPATWVAGSAQLDHGNGAAVWHGVLLERFGDQVNVVRVHAGTRHRTLVFSAGDSAQALW